ncbi:mandelate racemase/muconate lactonizing enzyme family protein [Frondihabitans australicus]|uniref:L-alanine-DL-glutamate epimerase-like enolase superfamily enzyme n=1 Tax=Frondihabitans australicus TaxID=386892 RepID=A0A495IKB4_9MICO|nr:mandelate racemase/muconate lactonizing enzyme family protein [Frondihabitans australicus]RKR76442.1 L-alanine-DL-glutamate epimerase-like enolase superfamily enzyme [Frondihabitans australicus]
MRLTGFEVLDCDLGWRTISFVKISADDGSTGWSECTDSFGSGGLQAVILSLRDRILGQDPRRLTHLIGSLRSLLSPAPGGLNQMAVGAVENALYDLVARHHGMSVAEMLGGTVRDRIPVYWSHCGGYRTGAAAALTGNEALTSYDDVERLGRQVRDRGFRALKTNVISFAESDVSGRPFAWARHPAAGGRAYDDRMIADTVDTLAAFRRGAGPDLAILLDVNYNYLADGYRRIARAASAFDLAWLELDGLAPGELAALRAAAGMPVASGESLFGLPQYLPYLAGGAVDVAIVDVVWNGIAEAVSVARTAAAHSLAVAPHNFYGHLSTIMSAHFCAVTPNLALMEVDVDGVPWRDDLVDVPPVIERGELVLPSGPGWGVEVNEEAIRAHAPRRR